MSLRPGCKIGCVIVGAWFALGGLASHSMAAEPSWQVEVGAGADHLSNGAPDWSQFDLAVRHRYASRSQAELNLRRTRRSGLVDEEVGAAISLPLDARWSASLAAAASPSHQVLARGGGRAEVARSFDGGWVASGVVGRRLYESGGNTLLAFGIERYVEAWRFAAQWGHTRLDAGGGTAPSARLQLDRTFDAERGRVGLILATGRELEGVPATLFTPADVIDQRVATLALVGLWPATATWALTGELSHARYGDLRRRSGAPAGTPYQRSGIRLGVRYDF